MSYLDRWVSEGRNKTVTGTGSLKKIYYHKNHKSSDTRQNCCNYPKIETVLFNYRVMGPKAADGMANSVDPDQTAPAV